MFVSRISTASSMLSLPVLAMAGVLTLSAHHAVAQTTSQPPVLSEVKVKAEHDVQALPAVAAGGQVAKGAGLGVLGNRDVMDTPFNITAYTQQTIADFQSKTLGDVLENDPSVRYKTNAGHARENFTIRGLEVNSSETAMNGMYGILPSDHIPVELIERVEVLKGPGALLNGMSPGGAVGGVVNVVTKRATAQDLNQLTTSYETRSNLGVHADLSKRFGAERRLGVRVNGSMASGETTTEAQKRRKRFGSLALDYQGDNWSLGLDAYDYHSRMAHGSPFMVGFKTGVVPAAPSAKLNHFRGIHTDQDSQGAALRASVNLNGEWTAFGSYGWSQTTYDGMVFGTRGDLLDAQGTMGVSTWRQAGTTQNHAADAGVRGQFSTGAVDHQLVLSFNQLRQTSDTGVRQPALSGQKYQYFSNLYEPTAQAVMTSGAVNLNRAVDNVISSYALADSMSMLDDKLQVTVGARLQSVEQNAKTRYDESVVTPMLGLVVQPWGPHLSFYGNYIEGLSAGQNVADAKYANYGDSLAPYKTKQLEAGVKWQQGALTQTVSVFQIRKPSVLDVVSGGQTFLQADGEQRNRGVEWNVFGQVMPGLKMLGGVVYTQAKQTKTKSGLQDGNDAFGVPRWTANVGADWAVPGVAGLSLNGRVVYTGTQYADAANRLKAPSWTRLDAGLGYATRVANHAVTLRANVLNLLDKNYWAGSFNDSYMTVGTPRTLRLSASMDF
jgi:iron complex outermembrane recepter protein